MVNGDKTMSNQMAVKGKSIDDYKRLVAFLKKRGYKLYEPLGSLEDFEQIKAVMIDDEAKTAHVPSTMIMACYVTCKKKVLSIEEYCQ